VNHPGICVGYRLNTSGGAVVFIPDNEPFHRMRSQPGDDDKSLQYADEQDAKLVEFIRDAEVLVMDAQYDRDEYESHVGWGHACVDDVVELAGRAGVKQLFLFHHDPTHDDQRVAQMVEHAKHLAKKCAPHTTVEAAREGLQVVLKQK
jgi:phosphoribosyl 1,2-cyclic phosphodiesterase